MLIRKLAFAVTLTVAGAAAHAGAMSGGGKDVGNLTDSLFGSKMYSELAVNASPAQRPSFDGGPSNSANAGSGGATVILPSADGVAGGGATVILPLPAAIGEIDAADDILLPLAEVPEPASLALMLAGMFGVGALRRRKQQR